MSLAASNLNALVALEALLSEQQVGRAARRMGVTPSAMSHTLRHLRELLRDPLLVRDGNTMLPTPYAEALAPRLRRGLGELEAILSGRAVFDPAIIDDQFTLATYDGPAALLLPELFQRLRNGAPRASLRVIPVDHATLVQELLGGHCDVALIAPIIPLERVSTRPGSAVDVAVVYRKGHPTMTKDVSLDTFCDADHLMFSLTGSGPSYVDHLLQRVGRSRRIAVRVPYAFAAPELLATSDLIATFPRPMANHLCERWPLESAPVPIEIPGSPGGLLLAWHPRFDADPAQSFFRDLVHEVVVAHDERV